MRAQKETVAVVPEFKFYVLPMQSISLQKIFILYRISEFLQVLLHTTTLEDSNTLLQVITKQTDTRLLNLSLHY